MNCNAHRETGEGERQSIAVAYGPKYPVAVVYAPLDRDFICFEPMAREPDRWTVSAGVSRQYAGPLVQ